MIALLSSIEKRIAAHVFEFESKEIIAKIPFRENQQRMQQKLTSLSNHWDLDETTGLDFDAEGTKLALIDADGALGIVNLCQGKYETIVDTGSGYWGNHFEEYQRFYCQITGCCRTKWSPVSPLVAMSFDLDKLNFFDSVAAKFLTFRHQTPFENPYVCKYGDLS